ncbi:MAG: hypothetical protein KDH88_08265 [Chromatiales bacterium]|nr:hypothetical protein [Chromatiales bacterium]
MSGFSFPCSGIARAVVLAAAAVSLAACSNGGDSSDDQVNAELRSKLSATSLTGDPSTGRTLPSIADPLPQLGKLLFYTKALGGDGDSACVTCHHPVLGGGDDLALPVGVGADLPDLLGPGRNHSTLATHYDGGPTVPRNAPSTFNIALWDSVLFWDGRVESLGKSAGANGGDGQGIRTPDSAFGIADPDAGPNLAVSQSRFPVTSAEEMRGFLFEAGNNNAAVRDHLQQRVGGYGEAATELARNFWLSQFQTAFNSGDDAQTLITFDNIVLAIGEYERSQVFVDTPWKAFVEGDDGAIGDSAKRGALLFLNDVSEGGAGCAACHQGDFFTDEGFHVLAIPQFGRGKGNGDSADDDFGRARETGDDADRYAFRTPTLLNVAVTGPWGHDGAYDTLEGIVRHHLNPAAAVASYDYGLLPLGTQTMNAVTNTQKALDVLLARRAAGQPAIQDVDLSDGEVADLVEFLHTLTDPCVTDRACLTPWIPATDEVDPDGLSVFAIDQAGNAL